MKSADEVGKDFDQYAKAWSEQGYALEVQYGVEGLVRDPASSDVQLPGDEWGDANLLRDHYTALVRKLALPESVTVLEIGAGGGRSTAALLDVLGDRVRDYHVIDVADAFVDTLRSRVDRPLDIHIVSDVDVSMLEDRSIDLVIAQSSWSHINLYDQYRYLRDLRSKMKHRAPIVVSGLFVLGLADGWTWNRFRRRVHQIDTRASGVYHEVTSVGMIAEMLARLGYEDAVVFGHGFAARRGSLVLDQYHAELPQGIDYGYRTSFVDWLASPTVVPGHLPPEPPERVPAVDLARIRHGVSWRVRKLRRRLR